VHVRDAGDLGARVVFPASHCLQASPTGVDDFQSGRLGAFDVLAGIHLFIHGLVALLFGRGGREADIGDANPPEKIEDFHDT